MTTTAPAGLILTPTPNDTKLHGLTAPVLTPPDSEDTGGGILNNLGDFVELDLADDNAPPPSPPQNRGRSHSVLSAKGTRDLTHAQLKRPAIPGAINTALPVVNGAGHLAAPDRRSRSKKKQSLSSKSTPSLVNGGAERRQRSPQPPIPARASSSGSVLGPPRSPGLRRAGTWGRRSSKEIEAEYDSDDEVPEDTIFYNIPLSPRSSRALSASTSPERKLSGESTAAGESTETGEGEKKEEEKGEDASAPPSPRLGYDTRSKSWTDLSDEVKELTEKLEEFEAGGNAEEKERRRSSAPAEKTPRESLRSAKSSVEKKSVERMTMQELPAVPNMNGIIDPLPMSKEKEAVLSRTRPSWLPPKSKEEEKRHLKEYQKMMRRSQDAERKRAEKARLELEARERLTVQQSSLWESQIIPDFARASRDPRTREMWWKGIPPRARGTVWKLAIGNHLSLSPESFRHALSRAQALRSSVLKSPSAHTDAERTLFTSIDRDIANTFPDLQIFQQKGPLHEPLRDLLCAYSLYRSDIGYVHGTHYIAALLLLSLPAPDAFVVLANILNRPLPLAFYTHDAGAMTRSYTLFLKAFQYKLPTLYSHIHTTLRIAPAEYLEPMFLTLFAGMAPVDMVQRLWDVYVFEGDAFLVRAAVGVLSVLESRLYGGREEVLGLLGWEAKNHWELGSEDSFMEMVRSAGKEERKGDGDRF